MQQYKSNAYVKFGATLDMGRFLANADPGKKARSKAIQAELKACRDQVSALTTGPVRVQIIIIGPVCCAD
jgi:ubiquitin carboxyl-terminal hydrolase 25/28